MSAKRITIDSNILIYAIDKDAGDRHEQAMQLVDQAVERDYVLTLQALCEFYTVVTRKGKIPHEDASAQIVDWQLLFPTIIANSSTLTMAMKAVDKYQLSFWDSMIWATAKQNGVDVILSEDFQHGQDIEGVLIQNPFLEIDF